MCITQEASDTGNLQNLLRVMKGGLAVGAVYRETKSQNNIRPMNKCLSRFGITDHLPPTFESGVFGFLYGANDYFHGYERYDIVVNHIYEQVSVLADYLKSAPSVSPNWIFVSNMPAMIEHQGSWRGLRKQG